MLKNKFKNILLALLLLLSIGLCYLIFGIHFQTSELNDCTATVRYQDTETVSEIDITFFYLSPHHVVIRLYGFTNKNGTIYKIFRLADTFYEGSGNRFLFKVTKSTIDPSDTLPDALARKNQIYNYGKFNGFYFTINRLDERNLSFVMNNLPLFVCTQIER